MKISTGFLVVVGAVAGAVAVKGYDIAKSYLDEKYGEPVDRPCGDCPLNKNAAYGKSVAKRCKVAAGKGYGAVKKGAAKAVSYSKDLTAKVKSKINAKKDSAIIDHYNF
jgi:hypothetical protein